MKTLFTLMLMTGSALSCPFEQGAAVIAPDGRQGTITATFDNGADGFSTATVLFDDGTVRAFQSQPGLEMGDNDLCLLRKAG